MTGVQTCALPICFPVTINRNIWNLSHQPDAVITIFDRYGKFLKQMSPASSGWDGIYNGEKLPSTDYWLRWNIYLRMERLNKFLKLTFL